jgi:hypothetical protein
LIEQVRERLGMNKIVKIVFRLPEDLHAEIRKWAQEENRSINGQVIQLLWQAVRKHNEAS